MRELTTALLDGGTKVQLRVYGCRWTHVTAVQAAAAAAELSMRVAYV